MPNDCPYMCLTFVMSKISHIFTLTIHLPFTQWPAYTISKNSLSSFTCQRFTLPIVHPTFILSTTFTSVYECNSSLVPQWKIICCITVTNTHRHNFSMLMKPCKHTFKKLCSTLNPSCYTNRHAINRVTMFGSCVGGRGRVVLFADIQTLQEDVSCPELMYLCPRNTCTNIKKQQMYKADIKKKKCIKVI